MPPLPGACTMKHLLTSALIVTGLIGCA
ncbi:MAG: META domain-containing protein, partial [Pseudomonas sp.]|nr:META domain-containing protein [Pseudomonas sp.]